MITRVFRSKNASLGRVAFYFFPCHQTPRRKPTVDRGSQDGGLSFTVIDSELQEGVDLPSGPALIMRRNSEGQEIRKVTFGVPRFGLLKKKIRVSHGSEFSSAA